MISHEALTPSEIFRALKHQKVQWAGNKKLKIYGSLRCKSGKRMKKENRVFFRSEKEAIDAGYRPCGHCLRTKYTVWKNNKVIFEN
ncbi:Ada metal-binding domain-containing protein [Flagellimonas sp.]|uniref:Ada metal-binding domain-containing protein n=1 Tax=Flagellimonas sp. TaxID=2058762 RepID=UPI003B50A1DC